VFVDNFFVGVLTYADDFVLLAPTPGVRRLMFAICDKYVNYLCVSLNANKSKYLIIKSHCSRPTIAVLLVLINYFMSGGQPFEIVDKLSHLGIITN
jgi:hypothetical protein